MNSKPILLYPAILEQFYRLELLDFVVLGLVAREGVIADTLAARTLLPTLLIKNNTGPCFRRLENVGLVESEGGKNFKLTALAKDLIKSKKAENVP